MADRQQEPPGVGCVHRLHPLLRAGPCPGLLLKACPVPLQPGPPGRAVLGSLLLRCDVQQPSCRIQPLNFCLNHLWDKAGLISVRLMQVKAARLALLSCCTMCANMNCKQDEIWPGWSVEKSGSVSFTRMQQSLRCLARSKCVCYRQA